MDLHKGQHRAPFAHPDQHKGYAYRAPRELRRTPFLPKHVIVVGSCLSNGLADWINSGGFNKAEHILFNNASDLPPKTKDEIANYDFQIVQIPTRSVIPEASYLRLSNSNVSGYQQLFEEARLRMRHLFDAAMKYNELYGIMTFVTNFLAPQQNPMGRLLPRYDLRNPVYFLEELNRNLYELLENKKNAFMLNADEVAATFGRRYSQDDSLWLISHGSTLANFDPPLDRYRIEPPDEIDAYYPARVGEFLLGLWHEAEALHATLTHADPVKLVVVDLDDTLWRGVVAEQDSFDTSATEGWPGGVIEALLCLKRRGIILAIVSKNDESTIRAIWQEVVGRYIGIDDFAVAKINWRTKAENLEEVLSEVNVLPGNTIFIDDNPIERAAITSSFPEVRVLGQDLYYIRRILLWSPETQVARITDESDRRTELIQTQTRREQARSALTREDFLSSLKISIKARIVANEEEVTFPRVFELLNKTNQFNTTGKRWSYLECVDFFKNGGEFLAFDVHDVYSNHGVISVAVISNNTILQYVMSCRVIGLEVELASIAMIRDLMVVRGISTLNAATVDTDANLLSRNLYSRCGFAHGPSGWVAPAANVVSVPAHFEVTCAGLSWPPPRDTPDAQFGPIRAPMPVSDGSASGMREATIELDNHNS